MRTNTINNANIITREIKTTRDALKPIENKIKGGACVVCGEKGYNRVAIHGQNNGVYLCDDCYNGRLKPYHTTQRNGYTDSNGSRKTNDKISIGFELETNGHARDVLAHFCFLGFSVESDCTVDREFISPIYTSFSSISKVLGLVESYQNNPNIDFDVLRDNVGLHTHYGYNNAPIDARIIANKKALFQPLADYINALPIEIQRKYFGRAFVDCEYCVKEVSANHTSVFNFQHPNTIEFRLMKFSNAEQTAHTMKIMRAVLEICFKNIGTESIENIARAMVKKLDKEIR